MQNSLIYFSRKPYFEFAMKTYFFLLVLQSSIKIIFYLILNTAYSVESVVYVD